MSTVNVQSGSLLTKNKRLEMNASVTRLIRESIDVKKVLIDKHIDTIIQMAEKVCIALRAGGKVLSCGNGGSAADAQHLAAELIVRLRSSVNRDPLPAIALAGDTSSLTACGNDYSFETYYERMVRAIGTPGDVLVGISSSGNSINVTRALKAARENGVSTLGLLGGDGGEALPECDVALVVPSKVTGRVQESHITIIHSMMELVENLLIEKGNISISEGS